jgi:predicted HicB family RNase H-like nuclease
MERKTTTITASTTTVTAKEIPKKEMNHLQLKITSDCYKKARVIAALKGTSVTKYVEELIKESVKKYEQSIKLLVDIVD